MSSEDGRKMNQTQKMCASQCVLRNEHTHNFQLFVKKTFLIGESTQNNNHEKGGERFGFPLTRRDAFTVGVARSLLPPPQVGVTAVFRQVLLRETEGNREFRPSPTSHPAVQEH